MKPTFYEDAIEGYAQLHRGEWTFTERKMRGDTHRALLLKLEELSPCLHESNKVTLKWELSEYAHYKSKFICECGTEVEPTSFVEKKK